MLKKIIIAMLGIFLLSGCADGFRDYFKKSANNKLMDTKGFKGSKRKPLYNKKYIELAKKNVIEENFDDYEDADLDEEASELPEPSKINRQIYLEMIKQDAKRKKRQRFEKYKSNYRGEYEDSYPSLGEISEKVKKEEATNQDLQKELAEIKAMLNEAKNDLTKYKCPMQQGEKEQKPAKNLKDNLTLKKSSTSRLEEQLSVEEDDTKPTPSEVEGNYDEERQLMSPNAV